MRAEHTPGPWEWDGDSDINSTTAGCSIARIEAVHDRAYTQNPRPYNQPEGQANAHLIAAAPELLAALKDAISDIEDWIEASAASDITAGNDSFTNLARYRAIVAQATTPKGGQTP